MGKIVLGYPCVGKTTLAHKRKEFIDLESSLFLRRSGDDVADMHQYIEVAVDLAEQGYIVFMSTHKNLRHMLERMQIPYDVIVPKDTLWETFKQRAEERYKNDPSIKNERAFERIRDYFIQDTTELRIDKNARKIYTIETSDVLSIYDFVDSLIND